MAEELEDHEPDPADDPGSPHSEATRTVAAPAKAAATVTKGADDLPPPIFPAAPEFKTATLRETCGPYRAGLTVTTDSARPSDPKGRAPIFVDAGRFAAWEKMGAFGDPAEKKTTEKKSGGNGSGAKNGKAAD